MIIQETTKMSEREKMAARNSNFCYLLNALYPVGSIYVSKDPTDPAEIFGGSWKRIKERFIWAIGDNENPGDTGGEKTHTLTVNEMPSHNHSPSDASTNGNWVPATNSMSRRSYNIDSAGTKYIPSGDSINDWKWGKTSSSGGSQPHNNMPPWEGFYIWERIESDVPMGGSAGMLLADQTYNPESANAQSGIAVAQAVETCSPAIITASDTGKALTVNDSSESVIKGLTAYGESTQDGTPTPDSPVEIVSVENPVISVYGKNFFDINGTQIYNNGVTVKIEGETLSVSGATTYKYVSIALPYMFPLGTTITLSAEMEASANNNTELYLYFYGSNNAVIQTGGTYTFLNTSGSKTWVVPEPPEGAVGMTLLAYSNRGNPVTGTVTATYKNIQIEIGSTATNYEPYTAQTVTVPYTFAEGDMLILNNGIVKVNISGEETDITDTETGQALLALKMNYPVTSVISDIDLNLTYRADTKNYIDNKIAEKLTTIETAILNNV